MSNDIADTILKLITYLGGGAALVFALSSWLGKVWASRILEKDRLEYQSKLERVKNSYEQELEKYKDQLEREKSKYLRYSEYQFKLYNDLWGSLSDLQGSAEDLWRIPDIKHLTYFTEQLIKTGKTVERNRILIEKEHYKKLLSILYAFRDFQVGKIRLIEFTKDSYKGLDAVDILRVTQIKHNQEIKKRYSDLANEIAEVFYKQIRVT